MNIENLSTLQIHKLTREQYKRELEAGRIDEKALYLTPDEELEVLAQNDPTGTGSLSLNRRAGTTIGTNSVAMGTDTAASGKCSHAEGCYTTASGYTSHAEGYYTTASGQNSHAEGYNTTSKGGGHSEGRRTLALGSYSHAEGDSTNKASTSYTSSTSNDTIISDWGSSKFSLAKGSASHVEGQDCLALGNYSHAEGYKTTASGYYSHAEGENVIASGYYSHAEGRVTTASGHTSHAEGAHTTAKGSQSHAEGLGTMAAGENQHVQCKYNVADTENKYAHIVGNGSSDTVRSNAHTLDWDGNAWFAGEVYVGGSDQSTGDKLVKQSELPESTTVDTTLAVSGQAADAKATGDAISKVRGLVGDTEVSTQIADAIANKVDKDGSKVLSTNDYTTADKNKLSGIATGAEVNQNAFTNITVGSTTISADSKTDTLTLVAGSNITLTPDATNDKITIAATSTSGYTHPSYTARTGVPSSNQTPAFGGTFNISQPVSDSQGHITAINSRTVTIPNTTATTSAAGLMSKDDKFALENLKTNVGDEKVTDQITKAITGKMESANPSGTGSFSLNRRAGTTIGTNSVAMGTGTTAKGKSSHAEGTNTTALGENSHAEGVSTNQASSNYTTGTYSGTILSDWGSAKFSLAYGAASHVEGQDCLALGTCSHAEGNQTTASGEHSHAEGWNTTASGQSSHAEGFSYNRAPSNYTGYTDSETVIAGWTSAKFSFAQGMYSHVEGRDCLALGNEDHAEGYQTQASGGLGAHAEGGNTTASGQCSHAEGYYTTANGKYSHAEGRNTIASGQESHAEGYNTTSLDYQHAQGHYNNTSAAKAGVETGVGDGTATAFVIGNGTNKGTSSSNAFRVTYDGTPYAKNALTTTGCDYAELFEWQDLNPDSEDRRGYFVTLDGDKIKIAEPNDYILGIVSGQPSVVGNGDEDWMGRYVFDEFGAFVYEEFEYEEEVSEIVDGEVVMKTVKKTGTKYKENPEYDHTREYAQRSDRPEWDAIGMLGVLSVRDDGSCQVNGYCKVSNGGIATSSETGYRVIKRVNDHIVKVIFR